MEEFLWKLEVVLFILSVGIWALIGMIDEHSTRRSS